MTLLISDAVLCVGEDPCVEDRAGEVEVHTLQLREVRFGQVLTACLAGEGVGSGRGEGLVGCRGGSGRDEVVDEKVEYEGVEEASVR